jgi:hypothetical protein
MANLEMSQQFADLVFLALDHGVESVREGGPLIPFIIFERSGERTLERFVAELLEQGEAHARQALANLPAEVTAYAFAYDGYLTVEGTRTDAIYVEASERGRAAGVRLAQRYTPKEGSRSLQTIGNAAFVGEIETQFK